MSRRPGCARRARRHPAGSRGTRRRSARYPPARLPTPRRRSADHRGGSDRASDPASPASLPARCRRCAGLPRKGRRDASRSRVPTNRAWRCAAPLPACARSPKGCGTPKGSSMRRRTAGRSPRTGAAPRASSSGARALMQAEQDGAPTFASSVIAICDRMAKRSAARGGNGSGQPGPNNTAPPAARAAEKTAAISSSTGWSTFSTNAPGYSGFVCSITACHDTASGSHGWMSQARSHAKISSAP